MRAIKYPSNKFADMCLLKESNRKLSKWLLEELGPKFFTLLNAFKKKNIGYKIFKISNSEANAISTISTITVITSPDHKDNSCMHVFRTTY